MGCEVCNTQYLSLWHTFLLVCEMPGLSVLALNTPSRSRGLTFNRVGSEKGNGIYSQPRNFSRILYLHTHGLTEVLFVCPKSILVALSGHVTETHRAVQCWSCTRHAPAELSQGCALHQQAFLLPSTWCYALHTCVLSVQELTV